MPGSSTAWISTNFLLVFEHSLLGSSSDARLRFCAFLGGFVAVLLRELVDVVFSSVYDSRLWKEKTADIMIVPNEWIFD
ncbi:hypothetical protein Tco_0702293 [Tanacetum coccineum]|uniref:Uncharacterized protein n=1 Tax=Tanacetum coccineum TaxID=301880 RepID=A0ABQ4XWE1_9ASTR